MKLIMLLLVFFVIPHVASHEVDTALTMAWSHNGDYLAVGTREGKLYLLNSQTGIVDILQREGSVRNLAWSPSDDYIVAANLSGHADIIDVDTLETLYSLEGETSDMVSVDWSPDGSRIVTVTQSASARRVLLWNASTGRLIDTIEWYGGIEGIKWSPDGNKVAVVNHHTIDIRDGDSYQKILTINNEKLVSSITWSRDGKRITTGEVVDPYDGTIRVWDVTTGALLHETPAHNKTILWAGSNEDESLLASASWDGTIKVWSTRPSEYTAELLLTIPTDLSTVVAAWVPHRNTLSYLNSDEEIEFTDIPAIPSTRH